MLIKNNRLQVANHEDRLLIALRFVGTRDFERRMEFSRVAVREIGHGKLG